MKNVKIVNELQKNKYKYIFLFTLIILGIITGIILSNIISYNDKKEIGDIIENYILNLKSNNLNYISNLINSLNVNFIYLLLIFICSISIIGIIINPLILYFKSFIIGFSIGIMINIYGYIGILIGIFSIFPHQIINIIIYLFLSFYGIKLSLHLISFLFLKKQFNFGVFMKKYLKVILASSIILIVSSLYETFLSDYVIKIFTFLLK